jgi:hypothetical protein
MLAACRSAGCSFLVANYSLSLRVAAHGGVPGRSAATTVVDGWIKKGATGFEDARFVAQGLHKHTEFQARITNVVS